MTPNLRVTVLMAGMLLATSTDALAQFRRPRPPRVIPEANRPAIGIMVGPSGRVAESAPGGVDVALTGEIPLHDGLRARAEIGATAWPTDPALDAGATSLRVNRAALGIYRLNGVSPFHTFIGGGAGLYSFRVSGAPGSGTKAGVFGGAGMEYVGKRRAFGVELRLNLVGLADRDPSRMPARHDTIFHGSVLVGMRRVF